MAHATPAARGVYKPRSPQASPLFRLVQDHLHRLQTVYDERFAREYGPWRPVVAEVADKFLACGILEHGFARIRCDDCAHEYCSRSRARAGSSARAATPSASRSGPSGWTRRCSRPCRIGRWCSRSPSGSAPTACIVAACSARSPASPPERSPPDAYRQSGPRRGDRRLPANARLARSGYRCALDFRFRPIADIRLMQLRPLRCR